LQQALARAQSQSELRSSRGVVLIAAGKAADAMVRGFIGAGFAVERSKGMIATTHMRAHEGEREHEHEHGREHEVLRDVRVFLAGHPVPTEQSEAAGLHALQLLRSADAGTPIVVLLSGGASALLAAPAKGLTLEDKMRTTRVLLRAGAAIHELNAVRKHLTAIKGGQRAAAAGEHGARVHTFALSDVISPVEDDPGVIGSGPTSPDATSFDDALAALERLRVQDAVPLPALRVLKEGAAGQRPETPKPGDPRLAGTRYTLIGSRRDAMAAARAEAERRGFTTVVIEEAISGEARDTAPRVFEQALTLARAYASRSTAERRPCCVIASGETTVRVTGKGLGGRNQEFALALAEPIAAAAARTADSRAARDGMSAREAPGVVFAMAAAASIGTDGIDGPTDAAGAIVDTTTLARALSAGLTSPAAFLADNDAYRFFEPLGDLVRIGRTDTNVCDLQVFLFA
jgi:glycerate 2-kinase